ncbi:MAG: IclR family transcriptional regulator [Gammaproteobacteria bacterium]|jgi:DNA-binding IclR family transcriptional regulator|nr:IclR family transcriptional regulator [Gammaproteobacteria bacterium]MBT3723182.1 IclR family transcriptional regulator [Gammaproteobacteria bacterium]MBT4076949.1 IclR family transcriptional regulator [Gammaproteobacteria bacterium]MBT4193713.1 IclR family transcriptional regulator [Gammaproteobacteria bacterium]MBT4450116.1 IclR family transcriptional regulator [Gammaproteobacteria bacterium]
MNKNNIKTTVKGGVQSVEVGMFILKTLATNGHSVSLNELSDQTGIHPSKIHRYLTSLVHTGIVAKTAHGQYDLGDYVLELSTGYLSRLDPTSVANPVMERLRSKTDEGIILNVWGTSGTTVIRWFQSHHPISVSIRPGATFLTTMSASGRVFLAYLPKEMTQSIVEKELDMLKKEGNKQAPQSMGDIEIINTETRKHQLSRVDGHSVQGISALSAPIFDFRGEITLTLALFGFSSTFDADWDGKNARLLKQAAQDISRQLGHIAE